MGLMVIIENKIKSVTSAWGANLTVLHIPPKMFVYYNFRWKLDISQNHKNKIWNWIKIQNCRLLMENKFTIDSCNVFDVPEWENRTHTKTKNAWKKK